MSNKTALSAAVYTELSDVEGEINGFMTYDRKVVKVSLQPATCSAAAAARLKSCDLHMLMPVAEIAVSYGTLSIIVESNLRLCASTAALV